jgi:hypothetical protein
MILSTRSGADWWEMSSTDNLHMMSDQQSQPLIEVLEQKIARGDSQD